MIPAKYGQRSEMIKTTCGGGVDGTHSNTIALGDGQVKTALLDMLRAVGDSSQARQKYAGRATAALAAGIKPGPPRVF
jgi:hypothetical protein